MYSYGPTSYVKFLVVLFCILQSFHQSKLAKLDADWLHRRSMQTTSRCKPRVQAEERFTRFLPRGRAAPVGNCWEDMCEHMIGVVDTCQHMNGGLHAAFVQSVCIQFFPDGLRSSRRYHWPRYVPNRRSF